MFTWFPGAIVVIDSSFAPEWVETLQHAPLSHEHVMRPDRDLLDELAQVLKPGHATRKTKAHRDLSQLQDGLDLYEGLGNQHADLAAVTANRSLFPEVAAQLKQAMDEFTEAFFRMKDFYTWFSCMRLVPGLRPMMERPKRSVLAKQAQVMVYYYQSLCPQMVLPKQLGGRVQALLPWFPPPSGGANFATWVLQPVGSYQPVGRAHPTYYEEAHWST